MAYYQVQKYRLMYSIICIRSLDFVYQVQYYVYIGNINLTVTFGKLIVWSRKVW